MKGVIASRQEELFVGALELAMLDLLRQEYLDNEETQYLYVVDFPRMAEVHCVPPLHLSMPEVTGLLSSPPKVHTDRGMGRLAPESDLALIERLAGEYPETLGLAEVLSRFVFNSGWSASNPKLMLPTQAVEAGTIEDALQAQSIDEWNRSISKSAIRSALDSLVEIGRKKNLSPEDFIGEVADKAQELLPAIYGEYLQVRQFLRFKDVKPVAEEDEFDARPVWFAQQVTEIRPYLEEINADTQRFRAIRQYWEKSIPDTRRPDMSGRQMEQIRINRKSDVDTLASIEYINERLKENGLSLRLAYLSDDAKLFNGASVRFGMVENRTRNFKVGDALGRPSAFDRSRHAAHLLRAEPEAKIRDVPLLDPRVLMTGRKFVDFAVAGTNADENVEPIRAITEWLPMFFNGAERNRLALANTYLTIQRQEDRKYEAELKPERFEQRQYDALKSHWNRYVRTIGTAHGLTRYSKRAHLRQLILAVAEGDRKAMERAIHAQLDRVMSKWLPAVGGATLLHRQERRIDKPRGIDRVRSVPPLLLPAWPVVQKTLIDLFGGSLVTERSDTRRKLQWLTEPTAKNLGLAADRKAPPWRINYIHSLGLAYGFACEGNWTASYRLATSAYFLADERGGGQDSADEHFISGREAAFLVSLSARRGLASRPHYFESSDMEFDLLSRLRKTLALENRLFDENHWNLRKTAHELRVVGEVLSWQIYRQLISIMKWYLRSKQRIGEALSVFTDTMAIQSETWATNAKILQLRDSFAGASSCEARHDYQISLIYLGRQILFNLLQLEIFGHLASDRKATKAVIEALRKLLEALVEYAPPKVKRDDVGMPWSCYENSAIQRAISIVELSNERNTSLVTKLDVDGRRAANGFHGQHLVPMQYSLSEWRLDLLEPNWREQVANQ